MFRVWSLGFRVQGFVCRIWDLGSRVRIQATGNTRTFLYMMSAIRGLHCESCTATGAITLVARNSSDSNSNSGVRKTEVSPKIPIWVQRSLA